jgi:hypothetical protein
VLTCSADGLLGFREERLERIAEHVRIDVAVGPEPAREEE